MARRRRALIARRGGFTLVELLVVISITIVLAGLVTPTMRSTDNASAEVRRVVADAARARSWARTTWRTATLDIDAANSRWRLIDDTGEILDSSNADANGWRTLTTGVSFQTVVGTSSDFAFEPDGRGTQDAAVQLLAGDSSWTVSMSAMSGTITAEEDA